MSVARNKFKSSGMKIGIPEGTYALLGHDNEIALLQPLRGVRSLWARWFWITEVSNIIPRPAIYSNALPIIVDGQKLDRPCVHHDAPAREAWLWRYMSLEKFEKMLVQGGIFLARADTFDDKLEGTLSSANELYRAEIYHDNPKMAAAFSRFNTELAKMKRWTYVSCWRIDESESLRSWKDYPRTTEAVAIQTTYGGIAAYTGCIFCAKVRYVDFKDTWIMEGNSLFPFIHKDEKDYLWENEFRVIVQKFPERDITFSQIDYFDCEKVNPDCGLVLQVNLTTFLEQVVIAPDASGICEKRVRELVKTHGLLAKVRRSAPKVS